MEEKLKKSCDQLIENYNRLRPGNVFEHEPLLVAGAALYLASGVEVDPERLRRCKRLLKKSKGVFSSFRGLGELIVRCKMALSDEPEVYLERLDAVYRELKGFFGGEQLLLAAMVLTDLSAPEGQTAAVERTKTLYKEMRKAHPWLTSEADMPFAALMAATGKDAAAAYEEAEKIYEILKRELGASRDSCQMLSHILTLYQGYSETKCEKLIRLDQGLRQSKHALSRDRYIAALGTLTGSSRPTEQLVRSIGETDDYLRQFKPFKGFFGVSRNVRRMVAVQLVESTLEESGLVGISDSAAVSSLVSTSIELTILMIILLCAVVAASSASSSH